MKSNHHQERDIAEALRRMDAGEDISEYLRAHEDIAEEVRELDAVSEKITALASRVDVPRRGLERALAESRGEEMVSSGPVMSPFSTAMLVPVVLRFGVPVAAFAVILLMVVTTTSPSGGPAEFDINSAQMRSLEMTSGEASGAPTAVDSSMMMSAKSVTPLPEATGSVEDFRAALIAGAEADREAVRGDDEDFAYATADDGTLTSLIQIYDGNL